MLQSDTAQSRISIYSSERMFSVLKTIGTILRSLNHVYYSKTFSKLVQNMDLEFEAFFPVKILEEMKGAILWRTIIKT